MTLKYIRFDIKAGDLEEKLVVAFSKRLVHSEVAKRLTNEVSQSYTIAVSVNIGAAGFVDLSSKATYGRSESMRISADPTDIQLFT